MNVVIADTSPLHYLALIEETHILPNLFGSVITTQTVFAELQKPTTPDAVKDLYAALPAWLEIRTLFTPISLALSHLDQGEQTAITLAIELEADTVLIDETKGREAARLYGLRRMGTLRVLYDAARRDLCDLATAFDKLRQTNFRATPHLYQHFLELYAQTK